MTDDRRPRYDDDLDQYRCPRCGSADLRWQSANGKTSYGEEFDVSWCTCQRCAWVSDAD